MMKKNLKKKKNQKIQMERKMMRWDWIWKEDLQEGVGMNGVHQCHLTDQDEHLHLDLLTFFFFFFFEIKLFLNFFFFFFF